MTEADALQHRRQHLLEQLSRAQNFPIFPKLPTSENSGHGRRRSSNMKKGKSRTRIARRDILRGMPRTRERVRDLKHGYAKQAYDGHSIDTGDPLGV